MVFADRLFISSIQHNAPTAPAGHFWPPLVSRPHHHSPLNLGVSSVLSTIPQHQQRGQHDQRCDKRVAHDERGHKAEPL